MTATVSTQTHSANAAHARPQDEDALAQAFLPASVRSALPDHALAVLARTAADWFAPSQARCLCVGTRHGRIRLAGHIADARPLARLKTMLLRLPGVSGLDMMITVEPAANLLPLVARSRRALLAG